MGFLNEEAEEKGDLEKGKAKKEKKEVPHRDFEESVCSNDLSSDFLSDYVDSECASDVGENERFLVRKKKKE